MPVLTDQPVLTDRLQVINTLRKSTILLLAAQMILVYINHNSEDVLGLTITANNSLKKTYLPLDLPIDISA
jgi:hypothetical protein